jgi:hypothetical protein
MTPRRRAILIVSGFLLLVAAIIGLWLWLRPKPAEPEVEAPQAEAPEVEAPAAAPAPAVLANPLIPPAPPQPDARTAAVQVAEFFAERYGSYSNQGDYQNLRDLLPIMTDGYRRATEAKLAETADDPPAAAYEGVTSVRISTKVGSLSEAAGSASVSVTLQQEKTTASGSPTVSYRVLTVALAKVGGEWKVSGVKWEN